MKKLCVLCLALIMICTTASAATWSQGLGPQKPYFGTPEVDFTKTIGYMMMYPVNGSTVVPGLDKLCIFMPREDVETGSGTMTLNMRSVSKSIEMEVNAETLVARPMTDEELDALLWGCGTVFEMMLEQPLAENQKFSVQMTEGCIVAKEQEMVSPAIDKDDIWSFDTNTSNVIAKLDYYRVIDGKEKVVAAGNVQAGDFARISIAMGEDAAFAAIYCNGGLIRPDQYNYTESVVTDVHFPEEGEVKWGVVFMDAEGKLVNNVSVVTEVIPAVE